MGLVKDNRKIIALLVAALMLVSFSFTLSETYADSNKPVGKATVKATKVTNSFFIIKYSAKNATKYDISAELPNGNSRCLIKGTKSKTATYYWISFSKNKPKWVKIKVSGRNNKYGGKSGSVKVYPK